jgi:hypothetical protein
MQNIEFQVVLNDQINQTKSTLAGKAKEYASDEDRLANFKRSAHLNHTTQPKAVTGMMSKHTVSVYDMVADGKAYTASEWDEKIGDHINYLILLKAALIEDGLYVELSANEFENPNHE